MDKKLNPLSKGTVKVHFSISEIAKSKFLWVILLGTWIGFISFSCEKPIETKEEQNENQFIGSQKCASCHNSIYDEWMGSHHELAMKKADESTVLADFSISNINLDGVTYSFSKREGRFFVRVKDIDEETQTYEISHTFGVEPLQQYLVLFPGGKFQALRISWDTKQKKWFHQYEGRSIEPKDWLHWTKGGQRWNTMCAECHSTDLQKNYNSEKDTFNTTYSEISVGCESCHGKGAMHENWAKQENSEGSKRILLGNKNQKNQINTCGPCHARRTKLTSNMQAGLDFDEQYILQTTTPPFYHGDGQILEEDYVLGSFIQSKMFHNGVTCSDCHNPHTLKLISIGNELCFQCHEKSYGEKTHHFHPFESEGSDCVNCHMPGKVYMGNDFRRDHSFRVPRPDQSVKFGTPNTCTSCHQDETDKWASNKIIEWYGPNRQKDYSDALLESSQNQISVESKARLLAFLNSEQQPVIAKASVLRNIEFNYTQEEFEVLIKLIQDSSPLVQYEALQHFEYHPVSERVSIALKHLQSPKKIVRIQAVQLIIDQELEKFTENQRTLISRANHDWKTMLDANSDFPVGRLQLGDYYLRTGDISRAIHEYEMALKMDPFLVQVHSNLATAYNLNGQNSEGLRILGELITLEPNYARAYYLRALLHNEMGNKDLAIEDLQKALSIDPNQPRTNYNLAVLYFERKQLKESRSFLNQALGQQPNMVEAQDLLRLINREENN